MANEKRLIDATQLIKRLEAMKYNTDAITICGIIRALKEPSTVDAVEVVHAEWACVNESENVWMCTGKNGCGNEILLLEGTPTENGWHYCPSCGADMR